MVEVAEVGAASDRLDDSPDLLVVGGPTPAFSMTRASTRGGEVIDTASFYVAASLGPPADGEDERARRWGRSLGERVQVTIGGPVAASRR